MKSRTLSRFNDSTEIDARGWANLATGIMWTKAAPHSYFSPFRHDTSQDELARFEWVRHDGKHYGVEQLVDVNYGLNISASFFLPQVSPSRPLQWLQFIESTAVPSVDTASKKTLVFYIGNADILEFAKGSENGLLTDLSASLTVSDNNKLTTLHIKGTSLATGSVDLFLHIAVDNVTSTESPASATPSVSFLGLSSHDVTRGVQRIKSLANENPHFHRPGQSLLDPAGRFSNVVEPGSTFLAVQIQFERSLSVRSIFYEESSEITSKDLAESSPVKMASDLHELDKVVALSSSSEGLQVLADAFDDYCTQLTRCFLERFETKFSRLFSSISASGSSSAQPRFTAGELEIAKRAVSAVLGGLGYFQGHPRVSDGVDDVALWDPQKGFLTQDQQHKKQSGKLKSPYLHLLTATPSRTSFPRGKLCAYL